MVIYSSLVGKPDEQTLKLVDFYSKLAALTIKISNGSTVTPLYSFEIDTRFNERLIN